MVQFSDNRSPRIPTMSAPEVQGLLPDIPGGETNLLPEALTRTDLKVWFTVPVNSDPTKGKETVELFVDGNPTPLVTREWTQPIGDTDRYVVVPQAWLRGNDGEHRFAYTITIYNGEKADSFDLVMTLDTVAPLLASSKLDFPAAILPPNKLTALYLDQNLDKVEATIRPAYVSPLPGDRITWYWGSSPGNQEQGGVIVLNDKNYTDPLVITITGELIRQRKDGWRYAWYQVQDRAGNPSQRSEPVELDVDATPIPRRLPAVKVKDAVGSTSRGVLNPRDAVSGAVVTVLPGADIHPGEQLFLQWAQKDTPGAHRTDIPIAPNTRDFRIPAAKVAWHIDKTLFVEYDVFEPDVVEPHKSTRYELRVDSLSGTPIVQCSHVSGNQLSLASLTTGWADFTIRPWTLIARDQFFTIAVVGTAIDGTELTIPVQTAASVPEVETNMPVGRISKANLQRYRIGGQLEVTFKVSFDNKLTWQSFLPLKPTLVL